MVDRVERAAHDPDRGAARRRGGVALAERPGARSRSAARGQSAAVSRARRRRHSSASSLLEPTVRVDRPRPAHRRVTMPAAAQSSSAARDARRSRRAGRRRAADRRRIARDRVTDRRRATPASGRHLGEVSLHIGSGSVRSAGLPEALRGRADEPVGQGVVLHDDPPGVRLGLRVGRAARHRAACSAPLRGAVPLVLGLDLGLADRPSTASRPRTAHRISASISRPARASAAPVEPAPQRGRRRPVAGRRRDSPRAAVSCRPPPGSAASIAARQAPAMRAAPSGDAVGRQELGDHPGCEELRVHRAGRREANHVPEHGQLGLGRQAATHRATRTRLAGISASRTASAAAAQTRARASGSVRPGRARGSAARLGLVESDLRVGRGRRR